MKVKYVPESDIAYIYIAGEVKYVGTHSLDFDIHLDLDEEGRLLGIEVLDATRRLDLERPFMVTLDDKCPSGWPKLQEELRRRKDVGLPVITQPNRRRNWIKDVGEDYVVLQSDESPHARKRKIKAEDIQNCDAGSLRRTGNVRMVQALRELGQYPGTVQ